MAARLKRFVERVLVQGGVEHLAHALGATRPLVLAYHNIVPDGEEICGDRSLHLPQRRFAAQLDAVAETYDVVPLNDLGEGDTSGNRRRVAITFDDAYRGTLTAGIEELARRRLPATVFVVPGLVGDHTFWWDALADAKGLADSIRQHVLERCGGRDAAANAWAVASDVPLHAVPHHARTASEAELHAAVADAGITLGSHSWSHPNLSVVGDAELARELESSREWLRQAFASSYIDWLAYPYGINSAAVRRATAAAGYSAAAALRPDEASGDSGRFAVPRINVPAGASVDGLRLLMVRALR